MQQFALLAKRVCPQRLYLGRLRGRSTHRAEDIALKEHFLTTGPIYRVEATRALFTSFRKAEVKCTRFDTLWSEENGMLGIAMRTLVSSHCVLDTLDLGRTSVSGCPVSDSKGAALRVLWGVRPAVQSCALVRTTSCIHYDMVSGHRFCTPRGLNFINVKVIIGSIPVAGLGTLVVPATASSASSSAAVSFVVTAVSAAVVATTTPAPCLLYTSPSPRD